MNLSVDEYVSEFLPQEEDEIAQTFMKRKIKFQFLN